MIGSKRIDQGRLDDCEEIMRRVPAAAARSRRPIAGTIARVFQMASLPLPPHAASPLPRGFLPRPNSREALTYLYPAMIEHCSRAMPYRPATASCGGSLLARACARARRWR